jgi:hypothetical protein
LGLPIWKEFLFRNERNLTSKNTLNHWKKIGNSRKAMKIDKFFKRKIHFLHRILIQWNSGKSIHPSQRQHKKLSIFLVCKSIKKILGFLRMKKLPTIRRKKYFDSKSCTNEKRKIMHWIHIKSPIPSTNNSPRKH